MKSAGQNSQAIEMRSRSLGELLDISLAIYRRNFTALMTCELFVAGPLLVLTLIGSSAMSWLTGASRSYFVPFSIPYLGAACLGLAILLAVATSLKEGAQIRLVQARLSNETISVGQAYRAVFRRWDSLWVAGAIQQLSHTLALVLWFVPLSIPEVIRMLEYIASARDLPASSFIFEAFGALVARTAISFVEILARVQSEPPSESIPSLQSQITNPTHELTRSLPES